MNDGPRALGYYLVVCYRGGRFYWLAPRQASLVGYAAIVEEDLDEFCVFYEHNVLFHGASCLKNNPKYISTGRTYCR